MTITYTAQVATCTGLGCFWKLLFCWKGSIYKLLWPNLVVYVLLYYSLYFVYLFALDEPGQLQFEKIAKHCLEYSDLIPLSFVLGFYVNLVVKRWWEMFQFIPGTDTLAIFISNSIPGQDERCRMMRRTIMRYVNLSYVMILSMVSTRVKKRFPTLDHLVEAGVMLPNEKKIFDDLNARSRYSKFWMPLVWAGSIVARARKEGRIRDDFAVKTIIDELCIFRSKCGALNGYDWVPVPLVYTQVVTLAVYTFFMATLMGRQLVGEQKDLYVPVFAFLQFFFYMGWLKVAESLVNPFGEDDDDFETNWLIDRNLQVSYLIVDEMHNEHPELLRDQYWDEMPQELPHTIASQAFRTSPHMGSTAQLAMTAYEKDIFPSSSQLHKLDEESEDQSTENEEISPDDGGEAGLPVKERSPKKKVQRQMSLQSEAPNSFNSTSRLRMSHKAPSVMSVFQKVFKRDNTMGSNASIASGYTRKPGFNRSNSRYSTTGVSRPHSPIVFGPQEDIFKMSDLSIDSESSTPVNTPIGNPPAVKELPPLNLKKANERRSRFGKNLSVEQPRGSLVISDTEDEPLIASNAPSPAAPLTASAQNSPMSKHKQLLSANKSSPKLLPKFSHSPQGSPRITRVPPVAFFMGSDASQTDRASTSKTAALPKKIHVVPLAEEEEDGPAEEITSDIAAIISNSSSMRPPLVVAARTHKDSLREVSELEPIDEQGERHESTSVESASIEEKLEDK
ncbi:bestrophin-1-like [Daphnia carinata]|uniref:bestrophin-1-like n=1 Tax=Daphnia carinata TaxID=120202 RepID=UPI00257E1BB9|nr:bestrophin-1-like [Daphnia carinata]